MNLVGMSEDELAGFRGARIGIVFQFFQLLPTLTALENTMLPMEFARRGHVREHAAAARERLGLVGLADKGGRFPSELSGGEQQRVAIARALALDPVLLVADEPTGNLDTDTAGEILHVFEGLNRDGTTIVLVTHDQALTANARRVAIRDGVLDGAGP
jgi:putative ABC transport system ATP-binding protein